MFSLCQRQASVLRRVSHLYNQFRPTFQIKTFSKMPPVGETASPEPKVMKLDVPQEGLKPKLNVAEPFEKSSQTAAAEPQVAMRFAKLSEHAFTPTRGSKQAAGFDLYSAYDYAVPSKGKVLAKTDIQIALPTGCYGRVAPRSGLAHKHFIDVGAGVIDQDYRGNVGVILFNFGLEEFTVKKGDRIAQLILERIYIPDLEELKTLDETDRGSGGFGSTGAK